MIIDSTDKPWILTISAATAAGAIVYAVYAAQASSGPSGGSWPGLIFGILGTAMMAFAGLLGARKKFPTLRIGRVQFWMRGHVWLGLLSVPMILFHGGFAFGGVLTTVLMLLFFAIVLSGILGVVLQQFIPRLMMDQVPSEIIYEQAGEFVRQLQEMAEQRVESLKPKPDAQDVAGYSTIREFYMKEVKPFLIDPAREGLLEKSQRATVVFDHIGKLMPLSSHSVVDDLRTIVQKRRDLATQTRLHHILHAWLLVHVPLSAALLVLTIIHAVMALRYS